MPKIKWKRGLFKNLPQLDEAEPALTTDTKQVFVGSEDGNVELAKKSDVDTNTTQLAEITQVVNSIDDYSTVLTKDASGSVTKVEIKDGTTVIQTTNITRDANGSVTSVSDIVSGKTVTTTINRDTDGTVSSISKAVV
jgi:hypothetical protein